MEQTKINYNDLKHGDVIDLKGTSVLVTTNKEGKYFVIFTNTGTKRMKVTEELLSNYNNDTPQIEMKEEELKDEQ